MSREDAIVLASRALGVLLLVTALEALTYLPGSVYTLIHYAQVELVSPSATQYYRHSNLISLSFLVVRIIGLSLMSRWLLKGGPEVIEWLLPLSSQEVSGEGVSQ